jgi:hypothetical protein
MKKNNITLTRFSFETLFPGSNTGSNNYQLRGREIKSLTKTFTKYLFYCPEKDLNSLDLHIH